jgi:uncharacterized membrane protein YraQ (UPF0718 family)
MHHSEYNLSLAAEQESQRVAGVLLEYVANFTTVFLGIFIEAAPFLLLGTVASGLVEVFVSRGSLARFVPRNVLLATLVGGVMGFVFPVCECGVVPLTRRLYKKGLPPSAGIAFLLAAPILNPVVLASTFAAYGWGHVLVGRVALALIVALSVGLIFAFNRQPHRTMRSQFTLPVSDEAGEQPATVPLELLGTRLRSAFRIAADEFFEMDRYLIIGSLMAALMQTFVPQHTLLAIGSGPLSSILAMEVLAFVLSVCSTVDAFLSLAFANTFATGSILSFLVFGPMVDVKSMLMFLGVFRRKIVAYLLVLPFLMTTLLTLLINLNVNW